MSGSITKVSPVDAALVALVGACAAPVPWSARVLDGAALAWCRTLSIPSVRTIARSLGVAPSTVIRSGGLVELYAEVIAREWSLLDEGWLSAHPTARSSFFRRHVAALRARDPVLLRLPGLVLASMAGAGVSLPGRLTVPWYSLAAFASADEQEQVALSA